MKSTLAERMQVESEACIYIVRDDITEEELQKLREIYGKERVYRESEYKK